MQKAQKLIFVFTWKIIQQGCHLLIFKVFKKKVWNTEAAYVSNYHFNFSDWTLALLVFLYKTG